MAVAKATLILNINPAPIGFHSGAQRSSASLSTCADLQICYFSLSPRPAPRPETLTCARDASSSDRCSALAQGALQRSPWRKSRARKSRARVASCLRVFLSLSPTCARRGALTCARDASSSDRCSALAQGALQRSPWRKISREKVSSRSRFVPGRVFSLSPRPAPTARHSPVRVTPAAAIVALLSRGELSKESSAQNPARESLESELRRACACFFSLSPTCARRGALTCARDASSSDRCSALARGALQRSPRRKAARAVSSRVALRACARLQLCFARCAHLRA